MQIISDLAFSEADSIPLWLCWECDARMIGFTKFKLQVRTSYSLFYDYVKQNTNLSKLQPAQRLTTHKLHNFTLQNNEQQQQPFQIITTENNEQPESPENIDVYTNTGDSNSEDEKPVMSLAKKQKRVNRIILGGIKKKKKRKRKEVELYKEIELSTEDLKEERRLAMMKEDYVNAMFRCERCILSFPNAEDLKDHVSVKHELNAINFKCAICECTFSSEVSYNYHTNKHRRRYECATCAERCASKRAVLKHYEMSHYHGSEVSYNYHTNKHRRRYECATCAERCASKRAVLKHYEMSHYHGPSIEIDVQSHQQQNGGTTDDAEGTEENGTRQSSATFSCEFCEKSFRWKASLRKHVETHRIETGQKRKPYCEPCRLSFTNTSNLQKHVKTSSKHQIQLKLRKLTESLPEDSSNPEKHQQFIDQIKCSVNSAKEKFPCPQCDKKFQWRGNLLRHLNSHVASAKEKYPCPQCDKKFQWRGNLLRHLNSHVARANGELVCEPCNRTFSSIATYKQHMKISRKHVSENDFKYMCSDCGKRFANKTRLKDHVDWEHLKNYVHTCPVCQKVFKSHTSLYLHKQVVHKKDNAEHLCDHCGKPFPNQAKLRCHMMALHSSTSAYKCNTCGARFSWLSCLSRHNKKLHPNLNPMPHR
ncbi:hypothetical protein PYW07_012654 [Mythimna separata]|uniref:C2H2-type domain-containing protein n=1 Tax=Mythimna separata TaxID=271217 RepID=A0AAD7Y8R7_MYTSE|nr:hypothetical protein PYW07_012654 [Mythimna separata]